MGRRVRQQRHGLGGGRQALPPLRDDQDNGTVVPPEGRIHRRRGREGGGSLDAESGASALANPAHPRWRDWRKYVGENGEKYIDANSRCPSACPSARRAATASAFALVRARPSRPGRVIFLGRPPRPRAYGTAPRAPPRGSAASPWNPSAGPWASGAGPPRRPGGIARTTS